MQGNCAIDLESLLPHVPLFGGLGVDELARIACGTREISVGKDAILFSKGDRSDGFYLIVQGRVKLTFASAQGIESVVDILEQGQTMGETEMFRDQPHTVSAQALSDARLLHFSKAVIFDELHRVPALRLKMLAGLARRLQSIFADVKSNSLQSGAQRFVAYLLRELPDDSPPRDAAVTLATSKTNIASQLNVTREHFSRILNDLSTQGLIVVRGRKILIPDVAELRRQSPQLVKICNQAVREEAGSPGRCSDSPGRDCRGHRCS